MRRLSILYVFVLLLPFAASSQVKILYDATKAESAANADWVIDADAYDLGFSGGPAHLNGGNEADPQRYPTPSQTLVTSTTPETYWSGALSSWAIAMVKFGYWVETLPYNGKITYGDNTNAQDLSNYKVFILDEPNILFTTAEKTALLAFVANGGGLFLISDHAGSDRNNDGYDSPTVLNDFMTSTNNAFGITWAQNDFSQTSTNFANLPNDTLLHGPNGVPAKMQYSGGSSLKINKTQNSSVVGVVYVNGCSNVGDTGVMMCHATYGNGKIVATGDSSPTDDGTGDPNDVLYTGWTGDASGNHPKLFVNATIWLAESSSPVTADSLHLLTAADTTVCSGTSMTITAAGATSYSWAPGGATTASITVQPSANTLYIVTGVTGGVTKKDTVHVTVDAFSGTTPQISAGGPLTFCSGSNVTLTATTETSYLWSSGQTIRAITAAQSGIYDATLTDATGCKATSNSVTVTSDAFAQSNPQISANGPLSFCTGGSVTLSAPAGYTYHWNNSSTQQTVNVTQSGSFFVSITDANNCQAVSNTDVVSVSANLTGIVISPAGPQTVCSGSSIGLSAPAGYTSYLWSNGSTSQSIQVTQAGTFNVIVSTGNNCNGNSDTAIVSVDNFSANTPQISANGPITFCQGGNVMLSASGGTTYNWSNGTQQSGITVSQSGNYQATITDANHCSAVSQSISVTVNPIPQITFAINPDSVCSTVAAVLLNASPSGGTFSGTGVIGSQFEPSLSGTGTQQITYTYTDNNSCTNTGSSMVTVYICTGLNEIDAPEISIYPNPSTGVFIFKTNQDFSNTAIRVFDETGRMVIDMPYTGHTKQVKIDLHSFANGMYIAELEQNNSVLRKKLVKAE